MSNDKMLKTATLILEKWAAELKNKDRKRESVSSNFDELFSQLSNAKIDFDTAHTVIEEAAEHHYPNDFVARKTYDVIEKKKGPERKTFREFVEGWKKDIRDSALESFYIYFNNEIPQEEEKQYGNMSAREYRAQRKYADSFPVLTFEDIQERMKKIQNDLTQPLDVDLEDDNGQDK